MNKTIYLEVDDEITSVIDKVRKVKTPDIILVVPKRAVLLQSIVNLKLLKKQAEILGKHIILVTADQIGCNLASRVGLVVKKKLGDKKLPEIVKKKVIQKPKINIKEFLKGVETKKLAKLTKIERPSISDIIAKTEKYKIEEKKKISPSPIIKKRGKKRTEIQKKNVTKPKKVVLLSSFNVKLFLVFLGVSLAIPMIIGLIILPKAVITIVPKTEPIMHNLNLIVNQTAQEVDLENRIISGDVVSIEKEVVKKNLAATGKKNLGQKARGIVTVYNKFSSAPQLLVASTRFVSADGKLFRSIKDITVPGAKVEEGITIPGKIDIEVEADVEGEEYNVGPSHFVIPGLASYKQDDIFGESKENFFGGKSLEITVVSKEDIENAKNALFDDLNEQIIQDLKNKIPQDKQFFESLVIKEALEIKSNPDIDQETNNFELTIKFRAATMVFSKEDLDLVVFNELEKLIPQEKYIIDKNGDISFEILNFDLNSGFLELKVHIVKTVAWQLDIKNIKSDISGKTETEAKDLLFKNPYIKDSSIDFWPFWVKKVPIIEKKIELRIEP